jgi:hypothetical protein
MKVENYGEKEDKSHDDKKDENYDDEEDENYEDKEDERYDDVKYDFLSNGDIVAYHNHAISIYSSSDWKRKAIHKLDGEKKIYCGVTNDRLLVLMDNNLFILDLSELSKIHKLKVLFGIYTFQYWKILLDVNVSVKYTILYYMIIYF